MRKKLLIPALLISAALFASSCKKEDLASSREEAPKFFIETEIDGKPLNVYSGKNNFITVPKVDKLDLLAIFSLSLYSSNFTNGQDSLQVGFLDVQTPFIAPVLPSKAALERLLANAQARPESAFADYPGVTIRYVTSNQKYTSPTEGQDGSYFRITKIEDYTPPGADHAMKKVDVSFRCTILSEDSTEMRILENGKAVLLFDYATE